MWTLSGSSSCLDEADAIGEQQLNRMRSDAVEEHQLKRTQSGSSS